MILNRRQALKAFAAVPLAMREKRELYENPSAAASDSVQNRRAIAIPNRLPFPMFGIGQTVRHSWICNDEVDDLLFGQELWMVGTVWGLVFGHPKYANFPLSANQWVYYVHWTQQREELGGSKCDWFEPCPESELKPLN